MEAGSERVRDGAAGVRPATAQDVPEIARLIRGLAEYGKLADECELDEERLRRHLFGEIRYAEALVADVGERVVGVAVFFSTYSTFRSLPGIWLEDLFVEPEHRGKGLGRSLLEAVIALARERGCGRVEWTALEWNEPAREFYERVFGAEAMPQHVLHRVSLPGAARAD